MAQWDLPRPHSCSQQLTTSRSAEWSNLITEGDENSTANYITTSHNSIEEGGSVYMIEKGFDVYPSIKNIDHSHPSGNEYPSGLINKKGDVKFCEWVKYKTGQNNINFRLYDTKRGIYKTYNENSSKTEFEDAIYMNYQDELIVTPEIR